MPTPVTPTIPSPRTPVEFAVLLSELVPLTPGVVGAVELHSIGLPILYESSCANVTSSGRHACWIILNGNPLVLKCSSLLLSGSKVLTDIGQGANAGLAPKSLRRLLVGYTINSGLTRETVLSKGMP